MSCNFEKTFVDKFRTGTMYLGVFSPSGWWPPSLSAFPASICRLCDIFSVSRASSSADIVASANFCEKGTRLSKNIISQQLAVLPWSADSRVTFSESSSSSLLSENPASPMGDLAAAPSSGE